MSTEPRSDKALRNLFVGGIPPKGVGDGDLRELFSKHGEVESANVIYNYRKNVAVGHAFVLMRSKEGAEAVIKALDGHSIAPDCPLKIELSKSDKAPDTSQPAHELVIHGFPPEITESQARETITSAIEGQSARISSLEFLAASKKDAKTTKNARVRFTDDSDPDIGRFINAKLHHKEIFIGSESVTLNINVKTKGSHPEPTVQHLPSAVSKSAINLDAAPNVSFKSFHQQSTPMASAQPAHTFLPHHHHHHQQHHHHQFHHLVHTHHPGQTHHHQPALMMSTPTSSMGSNTSTPHATLYSLQPVSMAAPSPPQGAQPVMMQPTTGSTFVYYQQPQQQQQQQPCYVVSSGDGVVSPPLHQSSPNSSIGTHHSSFQTSPHSSLPHGMQQSPSASLPGVGGGGGGPNPHQTYSHHFAPQPATFAIAHPQQLGQQGQAPQPFPTTYYPAQFPPQ